MDWITGEKFVGLADFVYYPKDAKDCNPLENTYCPCTLKEHNFVYTHTLYAKQLFEEIRKIPSSIQFTVITHNCDENVDESYLPLPPNVIKWYSQNVNVQHPLIESIPIGLENERWFKNVRKKEIMLKKLQEVGYVKGLVYMNHDTSRNRQERKMLYDMFIERCWVNVESGKNGESFEKYIDNICNHFFVICPAGNGMDTHRLWETLYMGSIPIVRRDNNNRFYTDLPILFVDNWEELSMEWLKEERTRIKVTQWNMEKLTFEYWKNKIRNGQ